VVVVVVVVAFVVVVIMMGNARLKGLMLTYRLAGQEWGE
jgi:hypothetical protein